MGDLKDFDLDVLGAYHDGLLEREAALMAELKEVRHEKRKARIEYHMALEAVRARETGETET